ncbi:PHP domain-containing protein [Bacillus haimaensis]|uniref:PHP domain-containing protein n=1 Tax=Bacillus haimaensis TaxID=3160967 RepID=UPI003AA927EF
MDIGKIIESGSFDLHVHTTASDGTLSPSEVVFLAAQKGISTIAITDHDTTAGLKEALQTGKEMGVTVIPGIELSTKHEGITIDILGYYIQETEELTKVLKKMKEHREDRTQLIINKFCEIGMPISIEDVKRYSQGGVLARPHIAKAIVEKGYLRNSQEVFDLYLGDGKVCSVDKMILSPYEGIKLIHNSRGIAVMAHPLLIQNDQIVEDLMKLPFDGLEVWHRSHNQEDVIRYKYIARKYGKIVTGGSDFHDENHSLGQFGIDFE